MINKELKLKYIKSLKSGGRVPKYQTAWGKLDKQDELDDWTKYWRYRTTNPSASSNIVGGWKPGSRNGYVESDEEYTARRMKEEQDAAKKRTKHIKKAADTAHMIGTLALPAGVAASAAVSLPATLGGIAGGVVGEKAVDYGLGKLADATGSKVRSWKDLTDKYLGWSPTLQMLTNPGTMIGGGIGAKGAQLSKGVMDYLIAMDMARYGHTPTTQYYFKPGYLGINGTPIENGKIRVLTKDVAKELEQKFGRKLTEEELDEINGYASPKAYTDKNGNIIGMDYTQSELDYANNNLNRMLNYEKGVPTKTTKYLKKGEQPYNLEDLVENGRLKEGTGLEESYSGSRGEENFFNKKDEASTRASKYLNIKYGTKSRESLGNVGDDNPHYRSGVILTTDGGQYSTDSFPHALKDLYRNLKQGRRYYRLSSNNNYVNANNFGQLSRYNEEFSPELVEMIKNSNGNIPEGIRVGMNRSSGTLFFQKKSDGTVIGRLWHKSPEEMIKPSNEWISKINQEFGLNINPARITPAGKIEWPNMYGILYKKGGNINYDKTKLRF